MPYSYRGTGTASILDVVERYDGSSDFSAHDGVFTCGILLNCHRLAEQDDREEEPQAATQSFSAGC